MFCPAAKLHAFDANKRVSIVHLWLNVSKDKKHNFYSSIFFGFCDLFQSFSLGISFVCLTFVLSLYFLVCLLPNSRFCHPKTPFEELSSFLAFICFILDILLLVLEL